MNVVSFTELRQNMAIVMNQIAAQHEPTVVTRQKAVPMVLMSLEDFNSFEETDYILRHPRNAVEIVNAASRVRQGLAKPHQLIKA